MAYATVNDVQARMSRDLSARERTICENRLDDAAVIIDIAASGADASAKKIVSCNMVMRILGDGDSGGIPIGATQGSMSALGYSQSWTIGSGANGELYLSKTDKRLLGVGNAVGAYSPVEELVVQS